MAKTNVTESLHPAAWPCALLIIVTVGRLPEIVTFLSVLPLGKIAVVFTLGAFLLAGNQPTNRLFEHPGSKIFAAIFFLTFIGISFSIWKSWSLGMFMGSFLSLAILFYSVVALCTSKRAYEFVIFSVLLSALLLAAAVIASSAAGRARASSTYDPNDIAFVLVLCLPFAIYFAIKSHGAKRILYFLAAGVFAMVVVRTQSRGGFLGLAAVTGYLIFFRPNARGSRPGKVIMGSVILLVGFLAIWQMAPEEARDRIRTLTNLQSDYNISDEEGRLVIWRQAANNVAARPWGYGLGTSSAANLASGGRWLTTHNSFLQIGVEIGVAGLLLLVLILIKTFRHLGRHRRVLMRLGPDYDQDDVKDAQLVTYVLTATLIGYLVCGFFLSQAFAPLLYVTVALAGCATSVNRKLILEGTGSQEPEELGA